MESEWRSNNYELQEYPDNNCIKLNKFTKIIIVILTITFIFSFKSSNKNNNLSTKEGINNNEKYKEILEIKDDEIIKSQEKFQQFIYKDNIETSKTLPYNLFIPEFIPDNEKIPLIIFINDADMVGKETKLFLSPMGANIWATDSWQNNHKCFVLVPAYNELIMDNSNEYIKSVFLDITVRLIAFIKTKFDKIDSDRVYITGQGVGGAATMYLISNYPYIFSAGLSIGGYWKTNELNGIINSTFTYVSSIEDKNSYNGQKEVKNYLNSNEIKINFGSVNNINLKENANLINMYIYNMYNLGYRHNFITFTNKKNKYNYGYEFNSIREWLFSQKMKSYDEYYKTKDGRLVQTKYCEKADINNICTKCIDGYFLSKDKSACTLEQNCEKGDKNVGLCTQCLENFYLDVKTKKCFSNQDNFDLKNCKEVNEGICTRCEKYFFLDMNHKCTETENCENSQNSKCIKCIEGFYLGIDHKCIDVEKCIYSRSGECKECIDGYYYNKIKKKCKKWKKDFLNNCKSNSLYDENHCEVCKDEFYLDVKNNLCLPNTKKNKFYKCQASNYNGEECATCVNNYFIGRLDKKCSLISGCLKSRDEGFCLKCDRDYCLDNFGYCVNNYEINEIEKKYAYRCSALNKNGNGCIKCEKKELEINSEGLCYDKIHCEKFEKNNCVKCQEENPDGYYSYCLNKEFGCIDSFHKHCLRCDDLLHLDECTQCDIGYELDKDGNCVKYQ